MLKPCPYVLGFQPERTADRHEGEWPARVIAEKPILSFRRALNKRPLRLKLHTKREKGIFEHSVHQRGLRAQRSEFDPKVEELLWQYAVIGRPLRCPSLASGRRPACLALVGGCVQYTCHPLSVWIQGFTGT
jgi:hypothetical protein